MVGPNIGLYYSLVTLLWQLFMMAAMLLCGISPIKSSEVMMFLKIFIPLTMVGCYVILRCVACLGDDGGKAHRLRDEISEVMLFVFSVTAFLFGAAVCYFLTVLLGAPLLDGIEETFSFSCLCSALTVFPLFVVNEARWDEFLNYLPESIVLKESIQDCVKMVACLTTFGAWCGAFPIPLDWDRDWQVWPITCCVGAISGHLIGLFYVLLASLGFIPTVSTEGNDWKHKIT